MAANKLSDEDSSISSTSSNNPYGFVKVAGIQYEGCHIVALSLQPGAELVLLRENHPKHPNAIRVNTVDGRQLGYVERNVANELADVFDAYGKPVRAEIVAIIGDDPTSFDYQVRICVDVPPLTKSASSVSRGELVNDSSLRLTKEQQDIIDHPLGYHAQVLAVAGSGKTTTMVYRIKHLVEHFGIQPSSICVLMFNRRVRKQFQEKLAKLNLQLNSVHTFHSFGREVIQKAINAGMGVQAEEWTEDKEEQVRLTIHKAIRNLRIDPESIDVEDAIQCVSLWKGALIPPSRDRAGHKGNRVIEDIYREYERLRSNQPARTYDDYVPDALAILQSNSLISSQYRNRFRIIIVDEYQDVNYGQQKLVEVLAGTHADVMVVGDDDQTIYEWRGARPEYLSQRFATVFSSKEAFPYHLSHTFRFGPILAQCAYNVIGHNETRVPKALVAYDTLQESTIEILETTSEQPTDINKDLAHKIKLLVKQTGNPKDIVVLARLFSQFAGLEAELLQQKIPYRVLGRKPFFERREVVVLLDYLRLAWNYHQRITEESRKWLRSTAKMPYRGLSDKAIASLAESMSSNTIAQILGALTDEWTSPFNNAKERERAAEFVAVVTGLYELMSKYPGFPAGKLLHWLVDRPGFVKHYDNYFGVGENSEDRKNAIAALLAFADQNGQNTPAFLQYIERLDPTQGEKNEDKQLLLTTIFRVKGEEFSYVIIPDCTEGNMPCIVNDANPTFDRAGIVTEPVPSKPISNERRLFYVAITRAKVGLIIGTSIPPRLGSQGNSRPTLPSPFLEEMEHDVCKEVFGEFQRCASRNFADLSELNQVAVKHAGNEQVIQFLINYYMTRQNLAFPEHILKRIYETPKVPFRYKRQYGAGVAPALKGGIQPLQPKERNWWDDD